MVVIVTVMSVMVYTYSIGLLGALLKAPPQSQEAVSLEYSSFTTQGPSANKNVTIYLRNIGGATITFVTYYVKDQYGNQIANTQWAQSQVPPNQRLTTNLLIANLCTPSCTTTGSSFTFLSGNAYGITLVSARNSQFTFTIVPA